MDIPTWLQEIPGCQIMELYRTIRTQYWFNHQKYQCTSRWTNLCNNVYRGIWSQFWVRRWQDHIQINPHCVQNKCRHPQYIENPWQSDAYCHDLSGIWQDHRMVEQEKYKRDRSRGHHRSPHISWWRQESGQKYRYQNTGLESHLELCTHSSISRNSPNREPDE